MIRLTARAAEEIRTALAEKGAEGFGLKVQVVGGGCQGFAYDLHYQDLPEREDLVYESQGVRLFVSPTVLPALRGLEIDHGFGRRGEGFVFKNPTAQRTCSCGASFSP